MSVNLYLPIQFAKLAHSTKMNQQRDHSFHKSFWCQATKTNLKPHLIMEIVLYLGTFREEVQWLNKRVNFEKIRKFVHI